MYYRWAYRPAPLLLNETLAAVFIMTEVILKENEFIIRLDNEDIFDVISGKQSPKVQLINPHKIDYRSDHLQVLKLLLTALSEK